MTLRALATGARNAGSVDVTHAVALQLPAALAAATQAMMHVASDHGDDALAVRARVRERGAQIFVAPITRLRPKVAAEDGVARGAEARRAAMREHDHRVVIRRSIERRAQLRGRVFHAGHVEALPQIASKPEARTTQRMRTTGDDRETQPRKGMHAIATQRHWTERARQCRHAPLHAERSELPTPGRPVEYLARQLRHGDRVVIARQHQCRRLQLRDRARHSQGAIGAVTSQITDEKHQIVALAIEQLHVAVLPHQVHVSHDRDACLYAHVHAV